ncbi:unnamed protein product [Scytosiphon promiscuus]
MPSTGNWYHLRGLLNHAGEQLGAAAGDVDVGRAAHRSNACCGRFGRRRPRASMTTATASTAIGGGKPVAAASIALRSLLVMLAVWGRPTTTVVAAAAAAAAPGSTSPAVSPAAVVDSATPAPAWLWRGRGGAGGGAKGAAAAAAPAYARNPPRDGVLYDELEVHWGATAREIKKAYYRLAVQHHPDKKPGDAQAEDRFKRVSEAYQILQDDAIR